MWWFLLKSIASSVFGSSFYRWFSNTRVGVWFQDKVDDFMEYVATKYNIEIAKREEKWLGQYPNLKARIETLETSDSKEPRHMFQELEALHKRVSKLEKKK
jgi:hypothetical protein